VVAIAVVVDVDRISFDRLSELPIAAYLVVPGGLHRFMRSTVLLHCCCSLFGSHYCTLHISLTQNYGSITESTRCLPRLEGELIRPIRVEESAEQFRRTR
jgi:hypothetical protein